jgi:putative NIF3 family GTP cyclohydrolase 1 type 2
VAKRTIVGWGCGDGERKVRQVGVEVDQRELAAMYTVDAGCGRC